LGDGGITALGECAARRGAERGPMLRCAALTSVEGGGGVELGWQCGGFTGDQLGSGEAKEERR